MPQAATVLWRCFRLKRLRSKPYGLTFREKNTVFPLTFDRMAGSVQNFAHIF